MDCPEIKQEPSEIELNLSLSFSGDGRVLELKSSTQTESLSTLLTTKIDSQCPQCRGFLVLNFIIHEEVPNNDQPSFAQVMVEGLKAEMSINPELVGGADLKEGSLNNFYDESRDNVLTNSTDEDCEPLAKLRLKRGRKSSGEAVPKKPRLVRKRKKQRAKVEQQTQEDLEVTQHLKVELRTSNEEQAATGANVNPLRCQFCNEPEPFKNKEALRYHINMRHAEEWCNMGVIECPHCCKRLQTKEELRSHLRACNPNRTKEKTKIFCSFCYQLFTTKPERQAHLDAHQKTCEFCQPPVQFNCWDTLRKHVRDFHLKFHPLYHQTVQCPLCEVRYHKHKLPRHLETCKKQNGLTFFCPVCNQTFKSRNYVQQHIMVVHEGLKNFFCDACGERFSSRTCLELHQLKHQSDPRPYKCAICPAASQPGFRHKFGVKKHIEQVHLNLQEVKTFVTCQECGASVDKKYVKEHMARHIRGRSFKCCYCDKGFFTKKAKQIHEAIHTDHRPHFCEICGARFRQKQGLTSHIRSIHSTEKPYTCEVCQQSFSDRGCYRGHLLKHEKQLGITLDKSVKKFSTK